MWSCKGSVGFVAILMLKAGVAYAQPVQVDQATFHAEVAGLAPWVGDFEGLTLGSQGLIPVILTSGIYQGHEPFEDFLDRLCSKKSSGLR